MQLDVFSVGAETPLEVAGVGVRAGRRHIGRDLRSRDIRREKKSGPQQQHPHNCLLRLRQCAVKGQVVGQHRAGRVTVVNALVRWVEVVRFSDGDDVALIRRGIPQRNHLDRFAGERVEIAAVTPAQAYLVAIFEAQ